MVRRRLAEEKAFSAVPRETCMTGEREGDTQTAEEMTMTARQK